MDQPRNAQILLTKKKREVVEPSLLGGAVGVGKTIVTLTSCDIPPYNYGYTYVQLTTSTAPPSTS
jgi:RecG-like helicase